MIREPASDRTGRVAGMAARRGYALLHGPLFARRTLRRETAASRISAYVYGNVLILAALIPVASAEQHIAVLIVAGTALSTFLAHTFAEGVGRAVRSDRPRTSRQWRADLRDSVPILTSALVPCVILAAAAFGWLEFRTAQLIAEITVLVRIGGTVVVIDRLNGERPGRWTLLGALLLAILAFTVVAVKVVLTH